MALETIPDDLTSAEHTNQRVRSRVVTTARRMEHAYEEVLRVIFENDFGLTAQQAADSLGTDAEDLFSFLGACKQTVEDHTSRTLTPVSTYGSVSNDGDGTVTITLNP